MMNHSDVINQQRYENMVRFAEKHERAKEATEYQEKSGLHKPALATIGKVLSNVGNRLQTRYGEEDTANGDNPTMGHYQLETAK